MSNEHYIKQSKEYLSPALRQYKKNDGSDGFVDAFDYEKTIELMSNMIEVARLGMGNNDYDGMER